MSLLHNEVWFESARQNLEEACADGDWPTARLIIADVEDRNIDASSLRRHMNVEMRKTDDVEFVPYTHPTPPTIKPSEMDVPVSNTFQSDFVTEYGDDGELHHTRRV